MKTNITYIDASKFEALIQESGLPYRSQSGFVKVQGPAGRQVYVAATKRVGRVDISGFEVSSGIEPHMGVTGNVRQQLDFSKTEQDILTDFAWLLVALDMQAPAEKKERKAPAKKESEPQGWSVPSGKQLRLQKIKEQAAKGPVA